MKVVQEEGDGHEDGELPPHDAHEGEEGDLMEITLNVVEGRQWGFAPNLIEIPTGQRVRLTLIDDGRAEHDVEIAELIAKIVSTAGGVVLHANMAGGHPDERAAVAHAMSGTTASVTFTPAKAVEDEFVCTIPGHKEAGMVGKLIVTQ